MAEQLSKEPIKRAKFKLNILPFGVAVHGRDTIMCLRTECHITGGMAGCHHVMAHQERHRGVPLLLLREEVSLLRELGVAELDGEWTYPETERDKLCYEVFKSLWRDGYYLTEGTKFGGDYLAYPEDPTKVHSTHIVVVKEAQELFLPREMIGAGRVGNRTSKNVLFCTMDASGGIVYMNLQWSGIA